MKQLGLATREPKDLDLFVHTDFGTADEWAAQGGRDVFQHKFINEWIDTRDNLSAYATLDELTTIKQSHAYWELRNGSWSKHMADLLALKAAGGKVIEGLHTMLYWVWEDTHGKKVVDLTQEAEEFFTDAVKRVYVHDSLHESVAYHDRPIYEECLKDGASVQMDMNKVWAMPFERQIQMFREEIYVTALERLIVPNDYLYSPGAAYQWALRRTITSLTRGKSARFLVDNFDLLRRPDVDYVNIHLQNKDRLVRLEDM